MSTYRHAQTKDLCYYKHPTGESCNETVKWAIKTERGHMFKVCDVHLPWSLHFSGLPARVNAFEAPVEEDAEEDEEPTRPFAKIKH